MVGQGETVRPLSDAISAASFNLTRLRDHLVPRGQELGARAGRGRGGGSVGGGVGGGRGGESSRGVSSRPYENETELRKEYLSILRQLLSAPGVVQMDEECNMRAIGSEAWDALPVVAHLRAISDSERATEESRGPASASSSTATSATSRKSRKYGPHTPDLSARKVERLGEANDMIQLSAIGEIKLDNFGGYEGDASGSAQACRDAQLLEGMCQTIWYVRCASLLFGSRMGILMINGSFKRFFLVDSMTLAVEVDPRHITAVGGIPDGLDVETLRKGMSDAACHMLCTLPNRIIAASHSGEDPILQDYDRPVLERLFQFWAEALRRAEAIPPDRPRSDELQPLDPWPMTSRTFPVDPLGTARIGRLKHAYKAELQRHSKSKGKRRPPIDDVPDAHHGPKRDDGDEDRERDGRTRNGGRGRPAGSKIAKRDDSRQITRLGTTQAGVSSQRALSSRAALNLVPPRGIDRVDRIMTWRASVDPQNDELAGRLFGPDREASNDAQERGDAIAEAAAQMTDCDATEPDTEAAAMNERARLLLDALQHMGYDTVLHPVTPTEMDALVLLGPEQSFVETFSAPRTIVGAGLPTAPGRDQASSCSRSSSLTGPPTPASPLEHLDEPRRTPTTLDPDKIARFALNAASRV